MDITGTDILQESPGQKREFEFVKGPVFANIVLADEINRAPAKTQAAMLEAMQEHKVTVVGRTYRLEPPFFVLATQNPIEQEGTYPLPEAQLDRFMFLIEVDYPDRGEEIEIARTTTGLVLPTLNKILDGGASDGLPAAGAPRAGAGTHLRIRGRPGPADATQGERGPGVAQAAGRLGERARGRCSTWCWAPKRGRRCAAATWCGWKTSSRWPSRS